MFIVCMKAIAMKSQMLLQRLAGYKAHCLPAIVKGPIGALLSFCSTLGKHLYRQSMCCQLEMATKKDINLEGGDLLYAGCKPLDAVSPDPDKWYPV